MKKKYACFLLCAIQAKIFSIFEKYLAKYKKRATGSDTHE
jgi:hypothetical protein